MEAPATATPLQERVCLSHRGITLNVAHLVGIVFVLALGIRAMIAGLLELLPAISSDFFDQSLGLWAAFFAGILATCFVQSSSAVTVMLVLGLASGAIPFLVAVAAMFGANIGTTITPLLLSFGLVDDRRRYSRALRVGLIHVWFNVLGVLVLLPLELAFGVFERISRSFTAPLEHLVSDEAFVPESVSAVYIQDLDITPLTAWILLLGGIVASFVAMRMAAAKAAVFIEGTGHRMLDRCDGAANGVGVFLGIFAVMLTRTSSSVVSAVGALHAGRAVSLHNALAIVLGANIGTTLTGILVASSIPGDLGTAALEVALIHFLFNLSGVLLLLLVPALSSLVLRITMLSAKVIEHRPLLAALAFLLFWVGLPCAGYVFLR